MGTRTDGVTVTRLRQTCPNSTSSPGAAKLPPASPCVASAPWLIVPGTAARERTMRLILGMILGAALTIGGAYVYDTASKGPDARPMVNWEVVSKNTDSVVTMIKQGWAKLTG